MPTWDPFKPFGDVLCATSGETNVCWFFGSAGVVPAVAPGGNNTLAESNSAADSTKTANGTRTERINSMTRSARVC